MEVYKEKCIGGGKCARVCPREAITSDYKSKHNKSPCNLDGDRNGEHPCFARLHRFCWYVSPTRQNRAVTITFFRWQHKQHFHHLITQPHKRNNTALLFNRVDFDSRQINILHTRTVIIQVLFCEEMVRTLYGFFPCLRQFLLYRLCQRCVYLSCVACLFIMMFTLQCRYTTAETSMLPERNSSLLIVIAFKHNSATKVQINSHAVTQRCDELNKNSYCCLVKLLAGK